MLPSSVRTGLDTAGSTFCLGLGEQLLAPQKCVVWREHQGKMLLGLSLALRFPVYDAMAWCTLHHFQLLLLLPLMHLLLRLVPRRLILLPVSLEGIIDDLSVIDTAVLDFSLVRTGWVLTGWMHRTGAHPTTESLRGTPRAVTRSANLHQLRVAILEPCRRSLVT